MILYSFISWETQFVAQTFPFLLRLYLQLTPFTTGFPHLHPTHLVHILWPPSEPPGYSNQSAASVVPAASVLCQDYPPVCAPQSLGSFQCQLSCQGTCHVGRLKPCGCELGTVKRLNTETNRYRWVKLVKEWPPLISNMIFMNFQSSVVYCSYFIAHNPNILGFLKIWFQQKIDKMGEFTSQQLVNPLLHRKISSRRASRWGFT